MLFITAYKTFVFILNSASDRAGRIIHCYILWLSLLSFAESLFHFVFSPVDCFVCYSDTVCSFVMSGCCMCINGYLFVAAHSRPIANVSMLPRQ